MVEKSDLIRRELMLNKLPEQTTFNDVGCTRKRFAAFARSAGRAAETKTL